jgi:hypothetical protein
MILTRVKAVCFARLLQVLIRNALAAITRSQKTQLPVAIGAVSQSKPQEKLSGKDHQKPKKAPEGRF